MNFFDPGEILNGGSKRKTKLCLPVGPIDCVCMTGPHKMKGNEIPTPHREVSLRRAQLIHKKFCGLKLFRDVGQNESVSSLFGHSQNQIRLQGHSRNSS